MGLAAFMLTRLVPLPHLSRLFLAAMAASAAALGVGCVSHWVMHAAANAAVKPVTW